MCIAFANTICNNSPRSKKEKSRYDKDREPIRKNRAGVEDRG